VDAKEEQNVDGDIAQDTVIRCVVALRYILLTGDFTSIRFYSLSLYM
jgi:hypothetical protein